MKKTNKALILLSMLFLASPMLSGCAESKGSSDDTIVEPQDSLEAKLKEIYEKAVESGQFEGTYQEWLDSVKGKDGVGIVNIVKTKTEGNVDTYTIELTDGRTIEFTITNGKDGQDGEKGDTGPAGQDGEKGEQGDKGDTGPAGQDGDKGDKGETGPAGPDGEKGDKGETGRGIVSIAFAYSKENIDFYIITYSDGTTSMFTITNGQDGQDGAAGSQGIQGIPGKDGKSPEVKISESGTWVIDGIDTKINVTGPKGDKGEQGEAGQAGQDGKSAFEIYKELIGYEGTEEQWLNDLINGNLGKKQVFTVKFNTNGGSTIPDQKVENLKKITRPENPTKPHYTFSHWEYQGEPWSFIGYVVTEDMTLDAIYEKSMVNYTAYLDNNMDGNIDNSVLVTYGENFTLTTPTLRGATFKGWYYNDVQITDANGDSLNPWTFESDINFVPVYTANNPNSQIKEFTNISIITPFGQSINSSIETVIDSFKDVEPYVNIEYKSGGSYNAVHAQVLQALNTETYPHITFNYPDRFVDYLTKDKLLNIEPYMNNVKYGFTQEEKNDYIASYMQEGRSYPRLGTYSLPFLKSSEAMFYNKSVLMGLDLSLIDPTINNGAPLNEQYINNLSWEELFNKLCPALHTYNQNQNIIVPSSYGDNIVGVDSDANLFADLAKQYGYGYVSADTTTGQGRIDFNNPGMKSLVKMLKQAYDNQYLVTRGLIGSYTSDLFVSGQILLSIGSTAGAKYSVPRNGEFEVGVAPIPHGSLNRSYMMTQGASFAVLEHANENENLAAWQFYKHLTTKDNCIAIALNNNYTPIRTSACEDITYLNGINPSGKIGGELAKCLCAQLLAEKSNDIYSPVIFDGSQTVRDKTTELLLSCFQSNDIDADIDAIFSKAATLN